MQKKIFIQGYGYSGTSAIRDFLKEFSSIYNAAQFEFDLCRGAGGIFELGQLIENGSFYTHDSMLKRFKKLINFAYYNMNWKEHIGQDFLELSESFLNELIIEEVKTSERVFSITEKLLFPKAKLIESFFVRKYKKKMRRLNYDKNVYYLKNLTHEEYLTLARRYLNQIFSLYPKDKKLIFCHVLSTVQDKVDHQLSYFDNYKVVIIDRDPRDIYVTMATAGQEYLDITRNINGFIESFIQRRSYHQHNTHLLGENLLNIKFEDLVLKYEQTTKTLMDFLALDKTQHKEIKKYFNPSNSCKTIGLYKNYIDQTKIRLIESKLKEFLY